MSRTKWTRMILLLLLLGLGSFWSQFTYRNSHQYEERVPSILKKSSSRISVIVPTFKEAMNIEQLCTSIFQVAESSGIDLELIIVDDDSKDGTVEIVDRLSRIYNIRISVRKKKRGLSSAVLHGFDLSTADILVVMDADLSHDPNQLPSLLAPIYSGESAFVLGSRYTKGGKLQQWPLLRRITSFGATLLSTPLIPLRVTDPMSGYFALRRDLLQHCGKLNPVGFKIGLELMVKCFPCHITEAPITFKNRERGESKLKAKEHLHYLEHLWHLYFFTYPGPFIIFSLVLLMLQVSALFWIASFPVQHRKRKYIKPI